MTMVKREPNNIWSRVREDRDIDDLIFGEESYYGYMEDHTCSVTNSPGTAVLDI